ncbi:hypothetical protein EDF62_1295 [Leucobacter luti]|uniref:Uncharacterized protein n=1 Tax=Leucobacter luti TaxID=340320 RepID=A0A4R6S3N3_9MICO|nr:hypothetical protein [Leucobacter luti]TDP93316.1 hypothetical protein EDF62_1295 [Leucobacter luti]
MRISTIGTDAGRAPTLATVNDGAQATRVAAAAVASKRAGGNFVRVAEAR